MSATVETLTKMQDDLTTAHYTAYRRWVAGDVTARNEVATLSADLVDVANALAILGQQS